MDSGYVQYDHFEKFMLRIVTEKNIEFLGDNGNKLLRAFKDFDPDYLKGVITTRGGAFREEEVEELPSAAVDAKTCNIF